MRKIALIVIIFFSIVSVAVLGAGDVLSAPAKMTIGAPPANLHAQDVSILDSQGRNIAGWYSPGIPGKGSILLLHGIRSNRTQLLGRANFLHAEGYTVLMIDLQAHGESDGSRISFGYREARGVAAAIKYLRARNVHDPIGVIGESLGAASYALADVRPAPNAEILESMYPTINEALDDRLRLRLGPLGPLLSPLLIDQLTLWLGIDASQLRPIDHMASLGSPVFIIAGTRDRRTTVAETRRIFEAARSPKALWLVNGAAHVNMYDFTPSEYRKRISGFLSQYMHKK